MLMASPDGVGRMCSCGNVGLSEMVTAGRGSGGVSCGRGWLVGAGVTGGCPPQDNLNDSIFPPSTSMSTSFSSGSPLPFHSKFSSILKSKGYRDGIKRKETR